MELDYNLIENVEIDGIDGNDYPDFSDAFISNADYNGRKMTEEELNAINEDSQFVFEQVESYLF